MCTRTSGYIYSDTIEDVQMKSPKCQMVSSSMEQNFSGVRGTFQSGNNSFQPNLFSYIFNESLRKEARILEKQNEKLLGGQSFSFFF